ncbi:hypothetical protein B046DRAFT_00061 [Streptomyces sp. LamerLS-316]|nr:hypothetical protein B046DRAFT_00061 [Streptomyces sp. LamerLS-316]
MVERIEVRIPLPDGVEPARVERGSRVPAGATGRCSARSKSSSAIEEFADDVQMAGVSCGLFDNMQDDPAQVSEFVPQGFGMTTPRGCR